MRLPASERLRWALVVGGGGLALLALDLWWLAAHRQGFPLNIDEAAYTTIGLNDYLGLKSGGLDGWWQAIQSQTPNAPLVPALASLLYVGKAGVVEGFGVLGAFMVLLGLAIYGIGERLVGARLGALCGLLAMTMPGVLAFAHVYVFALPSAALLACAVYALLRGEGLQRRPWALACGAALGLMLLTRTMTVAFVPGVLAAALLTLAARERDGATLRRGFLNLGLLVAAGAAVASLWYWNNLQPVLDYLTDFGYGGKSAEFGAENGLFSWARWSAVPERMTESDLLVPLAALLLAGLVAALVGAARRVSRSEERPAALRALAGGEAAAVAVVALCGYLALSSSRNAGFGFTLPVSVLLVPLAAIALRRYRAAAVPTIVVVALLAAVNLTASSNLWDGLSHERGLRVPALGKLPWISGVNYAVGDIRNQVAGPEARFAERDRGWPRADKLLAAWLLREGPPVVAFASRSRVLNTNTVGLAAVLQFQRTIPMAQLVADDGDTVAAYRRRLTDPAYGQPRILITTSDTVGDYEPHVNQARAATAARQLGFRVVRTMILPDGRVLRVWSQLT
jgi:4-amino-4-deoxy-L-arabinose transferase-like glycosyltransferase